MRHRGEDVGPQMEIVQESANDDYVTRAGVYRDVGDLVLPPPTGCDGV